MDINKRQSGMVDVSTKEPSVRCARASSTILFSKRAFEIFMTEGSPKGDVLATAKIAAVMAAKNTPLIVPLCHPLELSKISVDFNIEKDRGSVTSVVEVGYTGRTGVEMEALTAASAASLCIYDMMKWADKGMIIQETKLLEKRGGKSGDYFAE
ncbi:MAG: cyclic pyranopterin monophosphate synthase MoaC [Candidatus Omnitrophica bacterium]|nr:cyclic pyranopterin monophosphate synthase MoaC [Candidatus Omnitrophota bacterium]